VLMNTRGLTELVILQVGVQLKVLDQSVFTMLVLMAVVTTAMTSPLLKLFYPARLLNRDIEEAEQASLGIHDAYTVLVITDQRTDDDDLVRFGCDLLGHESPSGLVIARLLPRSRTRLEVASGLGAELALVAAAGDELRRLAAIAELRGTTCSVHSSLGDDRLADVAELARRADVDIVLVHEDWVLARTEGAAGQPAGSWPSGMQASVVSVPANFSRDESGAVVIVLDNSNDARAALRIGTQASLSRRTLLQLVSALGLRTDRRASAALDALRRAGFSAEVGDQASAFEGAAVIFAGGSAPITELHDRATLVRVYGGAREADRDVDEIARRITLSEAR
jgi:hypothetical protein